jgi:predicted Zn-dependent peptidase
MHVPPRLPFERHCLDNGLQIVLQPDEALPLVSVNLWYHVGSRDEQPGRTGLAHLFEHMLFQGSANVGTNEHFRYVQQVGGVANGSTWLDRTNYYETMPSHHLDLALWLESDRMGFLLPALDQTKLDRQRDVVLNERRQTVDNQPYASPYPTPTIGRYWATRQISRRPHWRT